MGKRYHSLSYTVQVWRGFSVNLVVYGSMDSSAYSWQIKTTVTCGEVQRHAGSLRGGNPRDDTLRPQVAGRYVRRVTWGVGRLGSVDLWSDSQPTGTSTTQHFGSELY